jgi:hypothetical protein
MNFQRAAMRGIRTFACKIYEDIQEISIQNPQNRHEGDSCLPWWSLTATINKYCTPGLWLPYHNFWKDCTHREWKFSSLPPPLSFSTSIQWMQLHQRAHSREEHKVTKAASIKVSIAAHNLTTTNTAMIFVRARARLLDWRGNVLDCRAEFSPKIILKEIRRILEPKTRALLQGHLHCVQGEWNPGCEISSLPDGNLPGGQLSHVLWL